MKDVSVSDVKAAIVKYFLPLFDPKSSMIAICTSFGSVQAITDGLKDSGYEVEVKKIALPQEDGDTQSGVSTN